MTEHSAWPLISTFAQNESALLGRLMIDFSPMERHEKVAISWSGGKDSTAVLHILRSYLRRPGVCVYTVDTGDLLPEMREHIQLFEDAIPNFVRIDTNVARWNIEYGLPSDLVPHSQHPVGQSMGESRIKLTSRYDCCYANLMWPLYERVKADGNTLLIRGTKRADMRQLPAQSGDAPDGIELWYPLLDWSHADVFAYLRDNGIPLPRLYDVMVNAPECARCTAWWREGRAAYLAQHYPDLARDYQARLKAVAEEIGPSIDALAGELNAGL
jgi:3'-phosphoadenosine 5'-phosphosulfate sulfotransferase (PAPS reductase)/FAD synthetase